MYANRNQEPPCEECLPPLLPDNEDVYRVYSLSANQLILSGMGDPLDINIPAVIQIIEFLGIERKRYVLDRVVKVVRSWLKEYRMNAAQKRELEQMRSKGTMKR